MTRIVHEFKRREGKVYEILEYTCPHVPTEQLLVDDISQLTSRTREINVVDFSRKAKGTGLFEFKSALSPNSWASGVLILIMKQTSIQK